MEADDSTVLKFKPLLMLTDHDVPAGSPDSEKMTLNVNSLNNMLRFKPCPLIEKVPDDTTG
jgi:hypothetical protein